MLYADVAVDTYQDPTKKLFTYRIPEVLKAQALKGAKVLVPFGKRSVEGYIWNLAKKKPSFPTKEIREVKREAFAESQMELAHWMAEHYLTSPLECLKCQLGKRGKRATVSPKDEITTLLLVPYVSQVKLRALSSPKGVLVGSRSAVFARLPKLRKISIEEPENWSYKDERAPYYHAKDVAQKRAEIEGLKLELKYHLPRVEDLSTRKVKTPNLLGSKFPTLRVKVIDLNREKAAGNFTFVSQTLEDLVQRPKRTIVYVNSKNLRESVKEELQKIGYNKNFTEIWGPELFSTPGKEVVHTVWVDADTLLNLPDFRAHEKLVWTAQKLGRLTKSDLYLQTSSPDHPLFGELETGNLESFYRRELRNRRKLSYPPFSTLVKLTYTAKSSAKVNREAEKMYEKLSGIGDQKSGLEVSPPYSPYLPTAGKVRLNIAVKAKKRTDLVKLSEVVGPEWKIEVDPESLL